MSRAPWLLLAVGNPSRGDDALGPALLDRLRVDGIECEGDAELLCDFQLQVEHALDLTGRSGVLFIDAARPGVARGVSLAPVAADERISAASHALCPQAVLQVALRLDGRVPDAWLLAIEGTSFELGERISGPALQHLSDAQGLALAWISERRQGRSRIVDAASSCERGSA